MEMEELKRGARLVPLVLVAGLVAGSLSPIWSNDYFWHLATGRWIVEHRALPQTDPLAVASSGERWINGEWLFQVAIYAVHRALGHDAISVLRALLIAGVFTFLFVRARREMPPLIAFGVTFLAWYGARPWLRERPATLGAVFLALLLVILQKPLSNRRLLMIALLVIVWMNVHPSALLAPVIVLLWSTRADPIRSVAGVAIAAAALLVNPYGLAGVLNPLHVAEVAQMSLFNNAEWARTSLREFPLFAIWVAAWIVALVTSARRPRWLASALTVAFLAALAFRFARNQPLLYLATPILLVPHVGELPERFRRLLLIPVAAMAIAVIAGSDFRLGVDGDKFPVAAAARVAELRLGGNVLSPYGMGGYLVWSFAPQRRVLTDGRNELFVEYQQRLLDARRSSAAWEEFLRAYAVGVAFVPRSAPPVFVRDAQTGARRPLREWDIYFPKERWALVAVDDAAAVFADRRAIPGVAELPRPTLIAEPDGDQ